MFAKAYRMLGVAGALMLAASVPAFANDCVQNSAQNTAQMAAADSGAITQGELIGRVVHSSDGRVVGTVHTAITGPDNHVQTLMVDTLGFVPNDKGQRMALSINEIARPIGESGALVAQLTAEQLEKRALFPSGGVVRQTPAYGASD